MTFNRLLKIFFIIFMSIHFASIAIAESSLDKLLDANKTEFLSKDFDQYDIDAIESKDYYYINLDDQGKDELFLFLLSCLVITIFLFLTYAIFGKYEKTKSSILESHQRRKIYDHVLANPGLSIKQLSENLSMHMTTLRHHLGMMAGVRLITQVIDGKYTRIFVSSDVTKSFDHILLMSVKNKKKKDILKLIIEYPGVNSSTISMKVGISNSTTTWYMDQLLTDGLVVNKKILNTNMYYINKDHEDKILKVLGYYES